MTARLVPLADVPRMQRLGWWCSDQPPMDGEIWMLSDMADAADMDDRAMAKRTSVLGIRDGAGDMAPLGQRREPLPRDLAFLSEQERPDAE